MTARSFPRATILGYPRIGRRRELTKALDERWAGRLTAREFDATATAIRSSIRERLVGLGLGRDDSSIPESFSLYDHVLDAAVTVGAIPRRFDDVVNAREDESGAAFALARGHGDASPLAMTKWFDTNYHHLVPEIGPDTRFRASSNRLIRDFIEARASGFITRPTIVGPVTLLLLSKAEIDAPEGFLPFSRLADLVPAYARLLSDLSHAGAEWVQLDEPALVSDAVADDADRLLAAVEAAYRELGAATERPRLFVSTAYGDIGGALASLAATPVEAIGLDLVHGTIPSRIDSGTRARLADKALVAGVIDGRSVWRGDLEAALTTAADVRRLTRSVAVSTSTSLVHVPHDVSLEQHLEPRLSTWLSFADQKVQQVGVVGRGLASGSSSVRGELDAASAAFSDRLNAPGVRNQAVRARVSLLGARDRYRVSWNQRREVQKRELALPLLPTTTIGSFPQTDRIRRARTRYLGGFDSAETYVTFIKNEIADVIALQEELGLDVLVHGEPERNDMVQYFAENLEGFEVTLHGWVQSYGSLCTRPPILWGDVSRLAPITVGWSRYAQSLTSKPVKGMLTGPVTILAWSFVRDDQPLSDTAVQLALALRDEIADLEAAGIGIIQIDEPALREMLPLRGVDHEHYVAWSVGAFRLATAAAKPETQIHTHLCASHFGVVLDAIKGLDADVTSIESAHSRMEIVDDIAASGFDHDIGPGIYDIHSPRVPSVDEVTKLLVRAAEVVDIDRLWVNPDCGLKTRGYQEATASLRNVLEAATRVRQRVVEQRAASASAG
ncbi:5-methyltetrahydropteroyltriglutamate--homocysteine S-methyltransferase [Paramicrobacterium chengjingii]|uniref:5-methyltetrahydropteroyltriglutamate--homocysteine S-methyltransferase n=1 Tax=Paramicrobacterium chengjingii TaxID=2769067 RepID=A0ABX6YJU5_9MICO|nr:5-methyltetrahydropteroyltriglutamate--homocysteine S-methyltransferase [Microbacterium chengjingii]QPZ39086.1 5-methyltetrahydropteroyltriglutamate--homocysteine S-methyltransferase [Microbacterium chengjingii]